MTPGASGSLLVADGDDGPVWSSDSRRIYFRSFREETGDAVLASIDVGTGERALVAASSDHPFPLPWTIALDDSVLGLVDALTLQNVDISMLSLVDGEFTSLLADTISESEPTISANGAWLAYAESVGPGDPNAEIDIRPFRNVGRTRIPVGRGQTPVFSRTAPSFSSYRTSSWPRRSRTSRPCASEHPAVSSSRAPISGLSSAGRGASIRAASDS